MTIEQIVKQKATLIKSKKSLPIPSEPLEFDAVTTKSKPVLVRKAASTENVDPNKLDVTIVGNTCLWCDSHMDVLAPGAFDETIKQRGTSIAHLRDHVHSLTAKVGKTLKVYTEDLLVADFGIESDVEKAQALLMDSQVIKDWDKKIFQLYSDEAINQHSIGLQYVRLELAVNDEAYPEEFAIWEKAFPQVINKDKVLDRGYFWWVTEVKVFEISAVLMGSNELTPTLSTESKDSPTPSIDTLEDKSEAADSTSDEDHERRLALLGM